MPEVTDLSEHKKQQEKKLDHLAVWMLKNMNRDGINAWLKKNPSLAEGMRRRLNANKSNFGSNSGD